MKTNILIFIIVLLLGCTNNKKHHENNNSKVTIDSSKLIGKKNQFDAMGILYESKNIKIIGDTILIDKSKLDCPQIKFDPFIYFEDFKSDTIYSGDKANIDYNFNKIVKRFRTVITEDYKISKINFASYYSIVWWGCGSPCQQSAIIDWRDGKVYEGPYASLGYDFRVDSKMVIVNPPDSTGFYYDCSLFLPQIWIWNENKKEFKEIKRKK